MDRIIGYIEPLLGNLSTRDEFEDMIIRQEIH